MSELGAALEFFGDRQAEQFTAIADIVRPIGEPAFDESTGLVAQTVETVYEDEPCKVSSSDRAGQDVQAGETELRLVDRTIKFAVALDLHPNDLVTIVSSTFNPTDVGKVYRITDVDDREWQVSRRCVVEETTVPMIDAGS